MKAFLSHSSHDKEFVRSIAKELGHQYCLYDEHDFKTGEEFKRSIEESLDESDVFVLFASRKALESIWVEFEIEEAWHRKLNKILSKSLVYIIDSSINYEDLPEFLRRAKTQKGNAPKVIARDIRHHLDELLRTKYHQFFVGRTKEAEKLEKALLPIDGSVPPHAMFLVGLPGIGRRSFLKHKSPPILNIHKFIEIRIGEGDSINDICLKVADKIEPYSTFDRFRQIAENIKNLSEEKAVLRTLENLRAIVRAGELPVIIDEGGIIDSEGAIQDSVQKILLSLAPNDDAYIFFVTNRKPVNPTSISVPILRLGTLENDEMKRLISNLANHAGITLTPENLTELIQYVSGHPDAAHFAINYAKEYGIESLMITKARLVQFKISLFLGHLAKLNLNDTEKKLLRILATYSPLTMSVMAKTVTEDVKVLDDMIVRLIDLSLIEVTDEGYYRIADPIADASRKAFGFPSSEQHIAVARSLKNFLQDGQIDAPSLELSRVLFRAAKLAKDDQVGEGAIRLSGDLIKLTELYYHEERYSEAIEFGFVAIEERPKNVQARNYLISALIQEERWTEAEGQIKIFRTYAPLKDVYYLSGFLKRKQRKFDLAINDYKEAIKFGRSGVSIKRELAYSYYLSNDLDEAAKYLEQTDVRGRNSDNPYLLNLWAQIAIRKRNEDEIQEALKLLELVDKPTYHLRLSLYKSAFGQPTDALKAAEKAVESVQYPRFEFRSRLASCKIESGELDQAEEQIKELERAFPGKRKDILLWLKCRIEIMRGRYGNAINLSMQFSDKESFYYKKLRLDALNGELKISALKDAIRTSYEKEVGKLEKELQNATPDQFLPI